MPESDDLLETGDAATTTVFEGEITPGVHLVKLSVRKKPARASELLERHNVPTTAGNSKHADAKKIHEFILQDAQNVQYYGQVAIGSPAQKY